MNRNRKARDRQPDPARFFDDAYRRLLAPFHSEAEARSEVAALREILGLAQDDRILDLGCGWGRHLRLLLEAGHDVVGLDRSLPLLRGVRQARKPIPLVAADMRDPPFPHAVFDVVLNIATSLGLFLDDDDALAALAATRYLLRPRGHLLLEGMHRDDVVAAFAPRDEWMLDDGTRVRARRRFDAVRGISYEVLRWAGPRGGGSKSHALRIRSATELMRLLERAGFRTVRTWGEWDGAPFAHDSPRLIVLAERAWQPREAGEP